MFDVTALAARAIRALPPTVLSPEQAHHLALRALSTRLLPGPPLFRHSALTSALWDMIFTSPVGLAAGFDKNAEVVDAMLDQGFGFVEIGSVTPRPQAGNPLPRLFRLDSDHAVINRMGFNNDGMERIAARLKTRPRRGIVGVNLGKNKDTEDAAADYEVAVAHLAPLASYVVINVSSPNTPGLRALQSREHLAALVGRTRAALNAALPKEQRPPLLLKIAPDLNEEELSDIAAVAQQGSLDGLIISNTTIARPSNLTSPHAAEVGGLSGQPLFSSSTAVLKAMYRMTEGKLPLIGVGGIASAEQAYAKIRAGASLVQLYTALVYEGLGLVDRINRGLVDLLTRDGFANIRDAVGIDHRQN